MDNKASLDNGFPSTSNKPDKIIKRRWLLRCMLCNKLFQNTQDVNINDDEHIFRARKNMELLASTMAHTCNSLEILPSLKYSNGFLGLIVIVGHKDAADNSKDVDGIDELGLC